MTNRISFKNDYSELAHPRLLKALSAASMEQNGPYGEDWHTETAKDLIRRQIGRNCDIHLVHGGTMANILNLSWMLRPHESVIACDTGHITKHETGAIEATGHKVNTVKHTNGKLTVQSIEEVLREHHFEHMVKPKAVYVSQSTEFGSIYTKAELSAISECCRRNGLYLYLDGARLGSAVTCNDANLTLTDIADLTDAFYIGGTKNGALFGEAIVLVNDRFQEDYRYNLKQRGALLAKGAVLGVQFTELFKDGLFFELASHANLMARRLVDSFNEAGAKFKVPPQTNMIFPVLPLAVIEGLEKDFDFYRWSDEGNGFHSIRLLTSWATKKENVEAFGKALHALQPR
jgi:threonine aldolase